MTSWFTHVSRPARRCRRWYPIVAYITLWIGSVCYGTTDQQRVWTIPPSDQAPYEIVSRFIEAQPGDVIQLEAGKYQFDTELNLLCSHVTVRGRGKDKTILSFRNQRFGAGGILARGDALVFEDLSVQDTAGNAIKVQAGNGVVFRRVRVSWTDGPRTENGAYGIYPVECQNVLIEDSEADGASDAGIYVGQCRDVIVRRCTARHNVAGLEIENTIHADVYENKLTSNTGGLLVFDLPGLTVTNGGHVRLFKNDVQDNNLPNFAPQGTMVADVPTGTGVMIMATDHVEVFDNIIQNHETKNVLIASFQITQRPAHDPRYDPYPEGVTIRDNRIAQGGAKPQGAIATLLLPVLGSRFPDIIYDGQLNPQKLIQEQLPEALQLRIDQDAAATFVDLRLDRMRPELVVSGAYKPSFDVTPFRGRHRPEVEVKLGEFPDVPPGDSPAVAVYRRIPRTLSEWGFFTGRIALQQPADGVLPYELNTQLFSDHTLKSRFIRLPQGAPMSYQEEQPFEFPNGTAIAKTFACRTAADTNVRTTTGNNRSDAPSSPLRLLETRIETRIDNAWYGFSYVWNEEQTEAKLMLGGGVIPISLVDENGQVHSDDYHVPNANQCVTCHGRDGQFVPIGPTARNLNRPDSHGQNQLVAWQKAGQLQGLHEIAKVPRLASAFDETRGSLAERARAYLDVNCAHCHQPGGSASSAGLDLRHLQEDAGRYGVWKSPVATGRGSGGHRFDIVPGKSAESILLFRMTAMEPAVRMPNLGRGLIDERGAELIRAWIDAMPESSDQAK